MDKLVDLPPSVGAAAVAELAFAFPQVEREIAEWLEGIALQTQSGTFRPTGSRRVVGALNDDILAWLPAQAGVTPETAAITIADDEILHLLRTAKQGRGNALSVDDVKRLPSLLMNPDAVYWDMGGTGEQKRDEGLVYVWDTGTRGAGKIIVRVNFKTKIRNPETGKRTPIMTNTIRSARIDIDPIQDLQESKGYIKIKEKP